MLHFLEVRQDIRPTPAFGAKISPEVVVLRLPAIRTHSIDIRAPTHAIAFDVRARLLWFTHIHPDLGGKTRPMKCGIAAGDWERVTDVGMFAARNSVRASL